MGLHHIVMVLWEVIPLWVHIPAYFLRGITFPIMAFFLVEGFRRTSNIKRYIIRLFIFALVSQVPHALALGMHLFAMPNIIFTILLGLFCLMLHDNLYIKKQKRALFVILFILIVIGSGVLNFEGGLVGPLLIFMYYVIKDEKKRRVWPLIMWSALMIISAPLNRLALPALEEAGMLDALPGMMQIELMLPLFVIPIGTLLIIPLLLAYNGERGRRAKWLFFLFYPVHWMVLAIVAFALGLVQFNLF
jgi:hypothetical protein